MYRVVNAEMGEVQGAGSKREGPPRTNQGGQALAQSRAQTKTQAEGIVQQPSSPRWPPVVVQRALGVRRPGSRPSAANEQQGE